MLLLKSTLGLLALASSLARATLTDEDGNLIRCDSDAPLPAEYFATHETYKRHPHSMDHRKRQGRTITVDTWMHVIARSDQSRDDGWLSNATLNEQMAVMNQTYNRHGIFFRELGRTWTINAGWTEAVYDRELEWKTQLRKGDYKTLNLFYIKGLGTLGRCYNPETAAPNANKTAIDGCMIQPETAPGGPLKYESKGKTTVHEIGHWFGLYHPWESHGNKITDQDGDGCYGLGDKVADTGAMSWRLLGAACLHANGTEKTQQDTCKKVCDVATRKICVDDPLKDPVDNIMGYCPDDMLRNFTDGQVDRMFTIWDDYRMDKKSS